MGVSSWRVFIRRHINIRRLKPGQAQPWLGVRKLEARFWICCSVYHPEISDHHLICVEMTEKVCQYKTKIITFRRTKNTDHNCFMKN